MNKYPYLLKFAILFSVIHLVQYIVLSGMVGGPQAKGILLTIAIAIVAGLLFGSILDLIYRVVLRKYSKDSTKVFPNIIWKMFVVIYFLISFNLGFSLYYEFTAYLHHCDYPSAISLNGGKPQYLINEECEGKYKEPFDKLKANTSNAISNSQPQSVPISEPKVDLKVNGTDNPEPIKYNSTFKLDYNISGDVSCYPYGGPVPVLKEESLPSYMEKLGWKDKSFVTFPNMATGTELIARDVVKGYVPFITLTMKCGEEQNNIVSDTITIPILK
jgi:hypothetical protein